VSGTIEIRLWILSWGDDVEVLAPAALRRDVADTLGRALGRYAEGGPRPAKP
jgi:proteasome accessory factor B